jgi:hypothetical protein
MDVSLLRAQPRSEVHNPRSEQRRRHVPSGLPYLANVLMKMSSLKELFAVVSPHGWLSFY